MSTRHVLFCTSDRPDAYFNVIAHAVLALGRQEFVLVAVGDEFEPHLGDRAAMLSDDLASFVDHLSRGQYWRKGSGGAAPTTTPLQHPDRFASVIGRIGWGSLRITRMGLDESGIRQFLDEEASAGSTFDVTACKNSVVAGVASALVARGGSPIYTFDLRKAPTYGEDDLLPVLSQSDYAYRDLGSSALIRQAVQSVNSYRINRRNFFAIASVLAIAIGLSTLMLPDSWVFLLITGLASFASIVSAMTFFLRE